MQSIWIFIESGGCSLPVCLKCTFRVVRSPIFAKCHRAVEKNYPAPSRALRAFRRRRVSIDHPIKYSWNQQQQPFCLSSTHFCCVVLAARELNKICALQYKYIFLVHKKRKSLRSRIAAHTICIRVRSFPMRLLLFMAPRLVHCCAGVCIDLMAYYPPSTPPWKILCTTHTVH